MAGQRLALIVANDEYDDAGLRRLNAPAQDADALADVLGDPGVGGFAVEVLHNETAQNVRTAVEDLFADRSFDDLLVLHFSCHGVKNAEGELFLAMRDTRPNRLASTGVAAGFVSGQMATSRAQRIALFLDCCYGGAFPRGMVVRSSGEAAVGEAFTRQDEVGEGRGRVVVTSSNAMQYAFEGGELAALEQQPSVFTGAVVGALTSGEADRDGDGWVGVGELFNYVSDQVRRIAPEQTPQMWTFGQQGDILVARSRIRRVTPAPLPAEVLEGMSSELPPLRFGVADLLRERVGSADLGVALAAWQALGTMLEDDSRKVAELVARAREQAVLGLEPPRLTLTPGEAAHVRLSGPPLARAVTARPEAPWLTVEYDDTGLVVSAAAGASGSATVTVVGPVGEVALPVQVHAATEPVAEPVTTPVPESLEAPVEPEPARRRPAGATYGWLLVALVGLLLLVANLPGADEYEKAWYNSDTGGVEPRMWGDPYVVGSFVVVVGSGWALRRRLAVGATWRPAAGACFGAAVFLLGSASSVLAEGQLTDERNWAWGVTLAGSLVVTVAVALLVRPTVEVRRPGPLFASLLIGTALLVETLLLGLGPESYNNVRGWTVLVFPVLLGALGTWALGTPDPSTRSFAAAAAVTFAAVQALWGLTILRALDLDYYSETGNVVTFAVTVVLVLALVAAAVLPGRRQAG